MSDEILSGAGVLPPRPLTLREKAAKWAVLSEEEKRKTRCCFTGAAPDQLRRPIDDIKVDLENEILRAVKEGCTTFISGMAPGTDIWAGNIVVRLKDRFPDLKLIAALPFPGFADDLEGLWREKYEILLSRADLVRIVCPEYQEDAALLRLRWMLDHASRLLAVCGARSADTRNLFRLAREKRVLIRYLSC